MSDLMPHSPPPAAPPGAENRHQRGAHLSRLHQHASHHLLPQPGHQLLLQLLPDRQAQGNHQDHCAHPQREQLRQVAGVEQAGGGRAGTAGQLVLPAGVMVDAAGQLVFTQPRASLTGAAAGACVCYSFATVIWGDAACSKPPLITTRSLAQAAVDASVRLHTAVTYHLCSHHIATVCSTTAPGAGCLTRSFPHGCVVPLAGAPGGAAVLAPTMPIPVPPAVMAADSADLVGQVGRVDMWNDLAGHIGCVSGLLERLVGR